MIYIFDVIEVKTNPKEKPKEIEAKKPVENL